MNDELFDRLKAATVLIRAGKNYGTGYLVAPDLVATCAHVIGDETAATIEFPEDDIHRNITEVQIDKDNDCASLRLNEPVEVRPLEFSASCPRLALWEGYGFVQLMKGAATGLNGVITDSTGRDDKKVRSVILTSQQVGAGMGAPLHGFSGSPVVVDGKLVGHIKRLLSDPENPRRPTLGVVFATPAAAVLNLLGMKTASPSVSAATIQAMTALLPKLGEREYHVIVNYRLGDRAAAGEIIERLEGAGFKVFQDECEVPPEATAPFPAAEAAIIVMSRAWLDSNFCRTRAQSFRTPAVIVRIDDCAVPDPWQSATQFDFGQPESLDGPALQQFFYSLLKQAPPAGSADAKVDTAAGEIAGRMIAEIRAAASAGPSRVMTFWKQWRVTGIAGGPAALVAAQSLIAAARPDLALDVLRDAPAGTRSRQLRALALAKNKQVDEAIEVLKQLESEGQLDAETGGLLGGRYKQKWQQTGQRSWLSSAARVYRDVYAKTGAPYPGINAATLALFAGKAEDSAKIAKDVVDRMGVPDDKADHWTHATRAEAFLLLNDIDSAMDAYDQAVSLCPSSPQDIAAMRRQARLILEKTGQPRNTLDEILQVPHVIAYSGHMVDAPGRAMPRFPSSSVGTVRLAIRARLNALQAGFGFGSAANGADLLVLEELLARGGSARVFLPFPRDAFAKTSVGDEWQDIYARVLNHERVEVHVLSESVPPPEQEGQAYASCNIAFQNAAADFAKLLDEEPVLLTVWNGAPGDGRGGTKDAVGSWLNLGYRNENIDIRG